MKIIVNPISGREFGLEMVKRLIVLFSQDDWEVLTCFTKTKGDGKKYAMCDDGEDLIIAIGGDGTVNEVVNGMYHGKREVPLAILPAGTVNDFGNHMNLPRNATDFYKMIQRGKTVPIDIGVCGEHAFINVCAGGLFTDIAYTVSDNSKSVMGRMAYYLEAVKEFHTKFSSKKSFSLRVKTGNTLIQTKALLFIIANSGSVGGIQNIAPEADVQDGLLDVLIFEEMQITEVIELLADIRFGKHPDNHKVMYFKAEELELFSEESMRVDLDGEEGEELPQIVKVEKSAIQLCVL